MIGNQCIGNLLVIIDKLVWIRLVMSGKTLVYQIRIISCYNNNMTNVIKRMRLIGK